MTEAEIDKRAREILLEIGGVPHILIARRIYWEDRYGRACACPLVVLALRKQGLEWVPADFVPSKTSLARSLGWTIDQVAFFILGFDDEAPVVVDDTWDVDYYRIGRRLAEIFTEADIPLDVPWADCDDDE